MGKQKIPESVHSALVNRGWSEAAIANMSPRQMFEEYCQWHGLIGWGYPLWGVVAELQRLHD